MVQENDNESESNPNINICPEIISKPYRVTMEFPLFFTILSVSLSDAALSNILLYRTCLHACNHNESECQIFLSPIRNNGSQDLEEEVQKYAAFVSMVRTIIESLAPAVLSLFLGVWSDTYGRKDLVVWPLLGISASSGLAVIYSMMDGLGPWWFILTVIPMSLSGGFVVLFTGAFCYLSDITSKEKRSLRMTIVEASVSAGSVLGSFVSSYLLRAVGNVYLLLITACLCVIAYIFTNCCVEESLPGAKKGSIKSVLDFKLIKQMIAECFKSRPNYMRAQILLLTIANSLSIFIMYGVMSLGYLYTRQKLHWAIQQYTIYSAAHTTIAFFGSFLGVVLLQKLFKVTDLAFSMIAVLSTSVEYVIKAFAFTTWHMYLAAAISLFRDLSSPLIRSMITKILPAQDIAKVFALMCAIEGVVPLISPAIYNSLYAFTISSFPGAFYILCTAITGICVSLLGFVQYFRWKADSITFQTLTNE